MFLWYFNTNHKRVFHLVWKENLVIFNTSFPISWCNFEISITTGHFLLCWIDKTGLMQCKVLLNTWTQICIYVNHHNFNAYRLVKFILLSLWFILYEYEVLYLYSWTICLEHVGWWNVYLCIWTKNLMYLYIILFEHEILHFHSWTVSLELKLVKCITCVFEHNLVYLNIVNMKFFIYYWTVSLEL